MAASTGRRASLLASLAAIILLGGLLSAATADPEAGDRTYTGCLTPGGQIQSVAVGDQPLQECRGNNTQIRWNEVGPPGEQGPPGPPGPATPAKIPVMGYVKTLGGGEELDIPGAVAVTRVTMKASRADGECRARIWIRDDPSMSPEVETVSLYVVDETAGELSRIEFFASVTGLVPPQGGKLVLAISSSQARQCEAWYEGYEF